MTMRSRTAIVSALLAAALGGSGVFGAGASGAGVAPAAAQVPQVTPELLLDQAKRLFDAFQYDQAVPQLDRLVSDLSTAGQTRPDLLADAYQYRARARFALGDQPGAEQDFSALLTLNPSFRLGTDVSPRVLAVFDAVKALTVGQLMLSLSPPGELTIGGRTLQAGLTPTPVEVTVGEQEVVAKRPGHTDFVQRVTIAAGKPATLAVVLERVSATLLVSTVPADVEVVVNGVVAGTTTSQVGGDASAGLQVDNLPNGSHRVIFRRPCFQQEERTITIAKPDEISLDPVRLTPSVARVRMTATDPAAVFLVDGARQGTGKLEIANLCEGPHVIEARGAKGRFLDRRVWKTGDDVTLTATLRAAFPVVATTGVPAAAMDRLQQLVERALDGSRNALIFFPPPGELTKAVEAETPPPGWLGPEGADAAPITRDVRRDLGRKLATRLEAQGVAAVRAGADFNHVTVTLLASGSGEPESLNLDLNDPASRTRVNDLLNQPLPRLVRTALDASTVDIQGMVGAMVVRVGATAGKAGLAVGDLITSAGGSPVASVADLRARLDQVKTLDEDVPLGVRTVSGAEKVVSGAAAASAETLPTRDIRFLYNRALLDLRDASAAATLPIDVQAARVNLAIVEMRLANWDDALKTLSGVQLPEGAGVSAGTVAYFVGLCHEALGQGADANAAFTRAAASGDARLSIEGPRVAPLAQAKLGIRR